MFSHGCLILRAHQPFVPGVLTLRGGVYLEGEEDVPEATWTFSMPRKNNVTRQDPVVFRLNAKPELHSRHSAWAEGFQRHLFSSAAVIQADEADDSFWVSAPQQLEATLPLRTI